MIGIATTFFWIFLLAYLISAVYSVKDLHLNFGEPQMSLTTNNQMVLSLPIAITNKGFYNIGFFNVTSEISDAEDFIVAQGSTFVPIIKKGEEVITAHDVTISIDDFLQTRQNYLFNDAELKIYVALGLRLAEMIPVQASTNLSVPWGAPFYNFRLGEPEYAEFSLTQFRVTMPISFENHAFFDMAGNIQIRMYNNAGSLVGDAQTAFEAPQHSSYNGFVEFYVLTSEMPLSGRLEVYFATPLFSINEPLVILYG